MGWGLLCVCGNGRRRGRSPSPSPDMGGGKKAPGPFLFPPSSNTRGGGGGGARAQKSKRRRRRKEGATNNKLYFRQCIQILSFVRIRKFVFVEESNTWEMGVKESANDLLKVKRGKGNALGASAAFPLFPCSALPTARFLFLFSLTKKLKLGSRRRKKSRLRRRAAFVLGKRRRKRRGGSSPSSFPFLFQP